MTFRHPVDPGGGRRVAVRAGRVAARRRRRHRRRLWMGGAAIAIVLVTAAVASGLVVEPFTDVSAAPRLVGAGSAPAEPAPTTPVAPSPLAAAPPVTAPPPTAPVLRLSGDFPTEGSGEFDFHPDDGPRHGESGPVRRFRVGVERGSEEAMAEFAAVVDEALGDPRGWPASGDVRLQRVGAGSDHDFTIYLATQETAGRMCLAGGVDIRIGGVPATSCRVGGKVVVNLLRWRRSVPDYVAAKVPLEQYRLYVVNHEVGHQLGRGHQGCPGRGRLAPVMQQQTLGLDGCRANSWPYPDAGQVHAPPRTGR